MTKIITIDSLTNEAISELLNGQALAIIVPKYISNPTCQRLSEWFESHPDRVTYFHELYRNGKTIQTDYGVDRVGTPYNSTYGKPKESKEFRKYYSDASRFIREIREACEPYLAPIDKLRLELDEVFGAQVAKFDGMPMFVGIGRITRPNATKQAEQPHFDSLPEKYKLDAQLGANVYLEMPNSSGELELWEHEPLTPHQISEVDPEKDWRSILGKSTLIKPEAGDLILLNTRRGHAVREYSGDGTRVSTSCFIGYKKGEPLMLWS